jgi:hypothetical protein
MSDTSIKVNCPVCKTPTGEAGNGLPVYSASSGVCGGVKGMALFVCGNDSCGVLFSRKRSDLKDPRLHTPQENPNE